MLLDLLFPNRCLHCNVIITAAEVVCLSCMEEISFTHWNFTDHNLLLDRARLLFPCDKASALMNYSDDSLVQKTMHELKYKNREKIGGVIAGWLLERIDFSKTDFDLIVPIPLHPKKQRERGFNQLTVFADTLSKKTEIPVDHSFLKRNFYKKPQAQKNRLARGGTKNLFSPHHSSAGKHVLLIDDVYTTGNTIASAAWEVIEAGNSVSILVMAVD